MGRWDRLPGLSGRVALLFIVVAGCGSKTPGNPYEDIEDWTDVEDGFEEAGPDAIGDALVDLPVADGRGDSTSDVEAGPATCAKDKDCESVAFPAGDTCQNRKYCDKTTTPNVCALTWEIGCCRERDIFSEGFEDGLVGWTVTELGPSNGKVTWQVTSHRAAFGDWSAYFGSPKCWTYYNGALDDSCNPVNPKGLDATLVKGKLTSPTFFIPPLDPQNTSFFVSFYVWIDSEPLIPLVPASALLDLFRVLVVSNPGSVELAPDIFTSVAVDKTTHQQFVHVVGDLSAWTNQSISLRLSFDSGDSNNNHFEGVYVDQIRVATGCNTAGALHPACSPNHACTPDSIDCTDDSCQVFSNALVSGAGVCEHPLEAGCIPP